MGMAYACPFQHHVCVPQLIGAGHQAIRVSLVRVYLGSAATPTPLRPYTQHRLCTGTLQQGKACTSTPSIHCCSADTAATMRTASQPLRTHVSCPRPAQHICSSRCFNTQQQSGRITASDTMKLPAKGTCPACTSAAAQQAAAGTARQTPANSHRTVQGTATHCTGVPYMLRLLTAAQQCYLASVQHQAAQLHSTKDSANDAGGHIATHPPPPCILDRPKPAPAVNRRLTATLVWWCASDKEPHPSTQGGSTCTARPCTPPRTAARTKRRRLPLCRSQQRSNQTAVSADAFAWQSSAQHLRCLPSAAAAVQTQHQHQFDPADSNWQGREGCTCKAKVCPNTNTTL